MTLSAMKLTESECQFQILNHTKTSKPGHSTTSITISEFEQDPRICLLTTLKEYQLCKTTPSSLMEHNFTMDKLTKSVLESSGIDPHKSSAYSLRVAAVSRAKQKDVSLGVILADVGRRLAETFRKF